MKKPFYSFILISVLFLGACNKEIYPETPVLSHADYPAIPRQNRTLSTINVPIEIPVSEISSKINTSIPPVFKLNQRIDCPETPLPREERCTIKGIINLGQVRLTGNGNEISTDVDLKGHVRMDIDYRVRVGPISDGRRTDKNLHFDGTLMLISLPTIGSDWSIQPNISAAVDFKEAYVRFGPKISVRRELKRALVPLLNEKINELEASFSKENNLRDQILPIWEELKNPIKLSDQHNLWVTLQPKELRYNEVDIRDGVMHLGVGMDIETVTYLGDKPKDLNLGAIPDLVKERTVPGTFNLNLPILVNYNQLSDIINETLERDTTELEDGTKIYISGLELFGDSRNLYVKAQFDAKRKLAKANGVLILKGEPTLVNGVLEVSNIDFDVETKNVLLNSAKWLLKDKITKEIQKKATVDVNNILEGQRDNLNSSLALLVNDGYKIRGGFDSIELLDFKLQEQGIFLHGSAIGEASVSLNNLAFD